VLVLLLVLDLLASHAEKRVRSFRNSSVSGSQPSGYFLDYEHEHDF
jgi:hypothetical protein